MKLFRGDGPRPMPLSERVYRRFFLKYHGRYLITDLQFRAKAQSLDYVEAYMRDALIFRDRWDLLLFAAREAPSEGLMLEFGVADGASLRYVASRIARSFHGFDSFEGLPEHWSGTFEQRGKFGRAGALPPVPTNARLYPGWFADTLPRFLAEHVGEPVALVHVDCSCSTSTSIIRIGSAMSGARFRNSCATPAPVIPTWALPRKTGMSRFGWASAAPRRVGSPSRSLPASAADCRAARIEKERA
jgi:hypothetical protein